MVLMRRSYLIAKTLILYRKAISLMKEIENSQVPFDILFLNAIKNTTKLDKTKLYDKIDKARSGRLVSS